MTQPRSFRLSEPLLEALQTRARERGESTNALAERYLDEGLRRETHPLIVFRDGPAGRRPALAGTRLDVWQVVSTLRESGNSVAEAAEYLGVPEQHVLAAVQYYAAFTQEIDEWSERMSAIAEREEEAWRREQAILA